MTDTANSKQIKYFQRLSMLYLLIQCDDCNNINRNVTLRQDKMLIKSLTEFSRSHRSETDKREPDSIYFASISEIVSSPPTRIQ